MFILYTIQDGAQFYVADHPSAHEHDQICIEAPIKVSDFDTNAAEEARKWARADAARNDFTLVFEDETHA